MGENKYTHQTPANNELWQVQWQPGTYPIKNVIKKAVAVVKEESKLFFLFLFFFQFLNTF
jgi:hypothetical protein